MSINNLHKKIFFSLSFPFNRCAFIWIDHLFAMQNARANYKFYYQMDYDTIRREEKINSTFLYQVSVFTKYEISIVCIDNFNKHMRQHQAEVSSIIIRTSWYSTYKLLLLSQEIFEQYKEVKLNENQFGVKKLSWNFIDSKAIFGHQSKYFSSTYEFLKEKKIIKQIFRLTFRNANISSSRRQ